MSKVYVLYEEALGFNASELVGYMQQNYSLDGYILKVGV